MFILRRRANTPNPTRQNLGPQPAPSLNRAAFIGNLFQSKVKRIKVEDLSIDDVVVAVMGPTGSGKSSFIEMVTGVTGIAGGGLESCTTEISAVKVSLSGLNLCFVDTPGFDDTNKSDLNIFKMISEWIISTHKKGIRLVGLLYFHRISDNRIAGTPLKNIQVFEKLCEESFDKLVLTTTMWNDVDEEEGSEHEQELKEGYWKSMIERGSPVKRFLFTRESAFEILTPIFDGVYTRSALLLQRETKDLSLHLKGTTAGNRLYMELGELVSRHRDIHGRIRSELEDHIVDSEQLQFLLEEHRKVSMELQHATEDVRRMKIPNAERIYKAAAIVDWTRLFSVFSLNQNAREVEEEIRIWEAQVKEKEQEWVTRAKEWEKEARERESQEREKWEARVKQLEQDAEVRKRMEEEERQLWEARSKQWEKEVQICKENEKQAREREKNERGAKEKEAKEREMWEARAKQLEQDAKVRELWEARSKQWEKEAQMWEAKEKEARESVKREREGKERERKEKEMWEAQVKQLEQDAKARELWEARSKHWEKEAQMWEAKEKEAREREKNGREARETEAKETERTQIGQRENLETRVKHLEEDLATWKIKTAAAKERRQRFEARVNEMEKARAREIEEREKLIWEARATEWEKLAHILESSGST